MTSHLFCGTFEAEAHWRDPQLARLPSLLGVNSSRVVEAMDEMLFAFCDSGDRVLTRRKMDEAHVDYLRDVGFQFECNRFDLSLLEDEAGGGTPEIRPSVFQRMRDERLSARLTVFLTDGARLEPFAVLPGAAEVVKQYRLTGAFPSEEVMRTVNAKSYSVEMRDRVGIANVGTIVQDVASLLDVGLALLRQGPFLIKDDYGVSGKGNQLVASERILRRIAGYLSEQTAHGKRISFVLEPYLRKSSDFSCQFRVASDGSITVLSAHELRNKGLAFAASCKLHAQLRERLQREGYFELMEKIGTMMHRDGYFGEVCVDSMLLEDGSLVPLVEINARKSMGSIKYAVDRHLHQEGRDTCLTYVSAVNKGTHGFAELLEELARQQVLFTTQHDWGILPLTAGTLLVDGKSTESTFGRFYFFVVCDSQDQHSEVLAAVGKAMERSEIVMH